MRVRNRKSVASGISFSHSYCPIIGRFGQRSCLPSAACLFDFLHILSLLLSYDHPHSLSVEEQEAWHNDAEHYAHHESITRAVELVGGVHAFVHVKVLEGMKYQPDGSTDKVSQ